MLRITVYDMFYTRVPYAGHSDKQALGTGFHAGFYCNASPGKN